MKKRLVLVLVGVMFCSGCSTLFTDSSQQVTFVSTPDGAHVKVGPYECTTPCTMLIPRDTNYAVEAAYNGKKKVVPFEKTMAGSTVLNILFWPGFIVDGMTGNTQKFKNTHFAFDFSGESPQLTVMTPEEQGG
jgi:hypothetical protein